jgi:phytoene desaturase
MKKNYNYRFWVSALSAACYLAKAGHEVVVLRKNATIGRARQLRMNI